MKCLFIICLLSVRCASAQTVGKVSGIPLPKWVDTTGGVVNHSHWSIKPDGDCLYDDSSGRLIRVESGKCSLVETLYADGKWIPFPEWHADYQEFMISDTTSTYVRRQPIDQAWLASWTNSIRIGDAVYLVHRRGKHFWLTRKPIP